MSLDRTDSILKVVEEAIQSGALEGPTQSFLAQYLAVVLYSEMEEQISDIVKFHLERFTDQAVALFVSNSMADLIKRISKSDIAKLTARFGDEFKNRFNSAVEERRVSVYSNVINARHEIGHRRGSNITVAEVREGHAAANHILDVLKGCLTGPAPAPPQAPPGTQHP
jgi:hypothetical protein